MSTEETTLLDWDSVNTSSAKKKDVTYLRLKSGGVYNIRLFHRVKRVLRLYANKKSAICGDPDNCPVVIKHQDIKPKERYAIIVIDRADSQVKVLEAPATVFKVFKDFWETNGIDPGGNDGPDWVIKVTGEGINTRYAVNYKMGSKPFSAEEVALLRNKVGTKEAPGDYWLENLFKPTDPTKIEAILGLTDEVPAADSPVAESPAVTSAAPATAPVAAKKGNDPFDF